MKEILSFLTNEEILKELLHGLKNTQELVLPLVKEYLMGRLINVPWWPVLPYQRKWRWLSGGILGPTRMEYRAQLVDSEAAEQLSSVLQNLNKNGGTKWQRKQWNGSPENLIFCGASKEAIRKRAPGLGRMSAAESESLIAELEK